MIDSVGGMICFIFQRGSFDSEGFVCVGGLAGGVFVTQFLSLGV